MGARSGRGWRRCWIRLLDGEDKLRRLSVERAENEKALASAGALMDW